MASDLDTYLATLTPEIRDLAMKAREFVKANALELHERVHLGYGSILFGREGGKMSDDVCYVAGHSKDVNLGFNQGASLPDPALLELLRAAVAHQ